jgi:oligoendopeptidase F
MSSSLLRRAAVAAEHTWNTASIFASVAAWEEAFGELEASLPSLVAFRGRLSESATTLHAWLTLNEQLGPRLMQIITYALMAYDVETTDQAAAGRRDRAISLYARFAAAVSFAQPEILALGPERVEAYLLEVPELAIFAHYLHTIERLRAHVRSAEVEQVLAMAGDPLSATSMSYMALVEADLRFADATDSAGKSHPVSRGTMGDLLGRSDRTLRRSAWLSQADGYLSVRNTLAATLAGYVRGNVFQSQVHGFSSALEAALAPGNIPAAVYHNVIATCNRHLPIWHRYWEIRRKALGLAQIEACDIFAPLSQPTKVSYEQAVEWICRGMAPLGEEYVQVSRAGLTHERWVDRYPNQAKSGGAYSGGCYGTAPFMFMNYTDDLVSMSTLAHELGHSMHSWHTNRAQPFTYSSYSLFVAEVASNFNQALVRGHLLQSDIDRQMRIGLLEEAMNNFHRYLFVMPILAQFELQMHELVESGQALTADVLNGMLAELFRKGYGPAVAVDPARDGIVWAEFPHLFSAFYVYQYASGIAAANTLAERVLSGEPEAAERYVRFLSTGGSVYPIEALRVAGVDMGAPDAIDQAFGVLERYVAQLEELLTS